MWLRTSVRPGGDHRARVVTDAGRHFRDAEYVLLNTQGRLPGLREVGKGHGLALQPNPVHLVFPDLATPVVSKACPTELLRPSGSIWNTGCAKNSCIPSRTGNEYRGPQVAPRGDSGDTRRVRCR